MSGDNYSSKGRNVLGDVTNQTLKRGLSLILGDAASKSRHTKGKSKIPEERDSEFTEHISSVIENLLREDLVGKDKEKIVSFLKDINISSRICGDMTAQSDLLLSISDIKENANATYLLGRTQSLKGIDTGMPENMVQAGDKESQDERVAPEVMEDLVPGGYLSHALRHVDRDLGVRKLASSKFGSIEWSRLPSNLKGGSLELKTCKFLKDSGNHSKCQDNDPLDGCSCSFCLKAAYIWSDLHYQDIKGRITALRKIQKEASVLVQKFGKEKDIEAVVSHSTSKPSELESNLFNQWRSLFLHMEGILAQEGNQLQADHMTMRDMRENCKMDLDVISRMPLKKD